MPVHVPWGGLVLSVALRPPTIEHCLAELSLAELKRNESLGTLIGLELEEGVPKKPAVLGYERLAVLFLITFSEAVIR